MAVNTIQLDSFEYPGISGLRVVYYVDLDGAYKGDISTLLVTVRVQYQYSGKRSNTVYFIPAYSIYIHNRGPHNTEDPSVTRVDSVFTSVNNGGYSVTFKNYTSDSIQIRIASKILPAKDPKQYPNPDEYLPDDWETQLSTYADSDYKTYDLVGVIPYSANFTYPSDIILGKRNTFDITFPPGHSYTMVLNVGGSEYRLHDEDRVTETTLTWIPDPNIIAPYYKQNSASAALWMRLYDSNGVYVGEKTASVSITLPGEYKPSISLTIRDNNNYTQKYGAYVQNKSVLHAEMESDGIYGSRITSNVIQFASQYHSGKTYDFPVLTNGSVRVVATTTDSRARMNSAYETINILPYFNPKVTYVASFRCDFYGNPQLDGNNICIEWKSEYAPLDDKNIVDSTLYYRTVGSDNWTAMSGSAKEDNSYYKKSQYYIIRNVDIGIFIEYKIRNQDDFSDVYSETYSTDPPAALLEVDSTGTGLAIGQMAMDAGIFKVNLPSYFNKDVTMLSNLLAKNHVTGAVESEVNGYDGSYICLDNGYAIEWATKTTAEVSVTSISGDLYQSSVTVLWKFPKDFVDADAIAFCSTLAGSYRTWCCLTSLTNEKVGFRILSTSSVPSGTSITFKFFAIGRWK